MADQDLKMLGRWLLAYHRVPLLGACCPNRLSTIWAVLPCWVGQIAATLSAVLTAIGHGVPRRRDRWFTSSVLGIRLCCRRAFKRLRDLPVLAIVLPCTILISLGRVRALCPLPKYKASNY